jgi:hypothetical protein
MSIGGLRETHFSPRNSLRASTRPFSKTMVLIAARSRKIKTRACSGPAMRWDHRSHDLDGAPSINDSDLSSFSFSFLCPCAILSLNDQVTCGPPNQWTRSISPFGLREFRFSNSACSRAFHLESTIQRRVSLLDRRSQSLQVFGVQRSQLSNLSTFLFFSPELIIH